MSNTDLYDVIKLLQDEIKAMQERYEKDYKLLNERIDDLTANLAKK